MKYILVFVLILGLGLFSACGTDDTSPSATETELEQETDLPVLEDESLEGDLEGDSEGESSEDPLEESLDLTLDELAQFDGNDGNKAYIAVDGIIYDVTDHPQWTSGTHRGQFEAGKDYSEEIREIPRHGTSNLDQVEVVGTLID